MTGGPVPRRQGGPLVVPALSVLMVLLLAAGWLMSARLVDGVPALAVATGRTAASFLAISLVALCHRRGWRDVRTAFGRPAGYVLLAFLGFFAYYSGTLLGIGRIGASRVGLIVSLLPCLTFVIGLVAFGERGTVRKVCGTVLAVAAACGYAAADGPGHEAAAGTGALLTGVLLALGGTFTYALYGYAYRQRMADVSPLAALPAITGAGAVMLGLTTVLFVPLNGVTAADWGGVALLGAGLTAPVFLISHELILRRGPLYTSAVALIVPFLIRLGEWTLGWAGAPGPVVLVLIVACAAGVWLTVGGSRRADPAPSGATDADADADADATDADSATDQPSGIRQEQGTS
ncbi:DMT family transporter [Streptomyces sp. NA02950]|uniref:DMT family transporter n=1 Tax=Streptomyces sp. NA02950 TaxID=2742137 RepID=UPI00159052E0|nr:DMT family transporter [Streptomyces sp. NA02950]QKV96352.1 DMT family transporter [Streptomyces sp. NA02950]